MPIPHLCPEDPLSIEIRVQPLSGPPLVRDYLAGVAPAAGYYEGAPGDLGAYRRKLRDVGERFDRAARARAAAALRPTSPAAAARLARFVEEGGAVVTTGQQTGLFTGPLYTVLKALTAVRLAQTLEAQLGVVVLPVFWSASEDHDWKEVNHTFVADPRSGLRRIQLADPETAPIPMSDRLLGNGIEIALGELGQAIGRQGDADAVLTLVVDAYRPGNTVGNAFSGLLSRLLAPFDVCLTDAADPRLKEVSGPVLIRGLEEAEVQEELLRERSAVLEAEGYHAQVGVLEGATNVFVRGGAGRERLYRDGGGFLGHDSGMRYSLDELRALQARDPKSLSPNVMLRPVVESAVFPTLAYVAGPGEISYFAQLGVLFQEYGIVPPVVYPRVSMTLVEPAMRRLEGRLGVRPEALARSWHVLAEEAARRAVPEELREALEETRRAVAEGYQRIITAADALGPDLQGALGAVRNRALLNLAEADRKVTRHMKRREEAALDQLRRLRENLRPDGAPQERILNVLPFLARHGSGLLREMADAIPVQLSARAAAGGEPAGRALA